MTANEPLNQIDFMAKADKTFVMKNTIRILILVLWPILFFSGCQTNSASTLAAFDPFQIHKLTSSGIETIAVTPSNSAWPMWQNLKTTPLTVNASSLRVAVIGDTGCRLKESNGNGVYQDCSDPKAWPYPEVAKTLLTENYDFAIHTGDFHYREQCSDPKVCAALTHHVGYGWETWWEDYFEPTLNLLKKTPWLFVRGNHEDCRRAYQGWSILSPVIQKSGEACLPVEPFQWIELSDLVFINFDNSSFQDRKTLSAAEVELWQAKLIEVRKKIESLKTKKEIWFVLHEPVLGFYPDPADAEPVAISQNMEEMLKQSGVYEKVDFFLSGHIHSQQVIAVKDKLQLIVGHSGSSIDSFGRILNTEKIISTTESKKSFGYAIFQRTGFKKWNFTFKDVNGKTKLDCHAEAGSVQCD